MHRGGPSAPFASSFFLLIYFRNIIFMMVLESVTFDGPLVGEDEAKGTPGSCTDLTENCIFIFIF